MEMFERGFTTKISPHLLIHTEEQHLNYNLNGSVCCTTESLCMWQLTPKSLWAAQDRNRLESVTVNFNHKTNRYAVLLQQLSVQACYTWLVQAGGPKINDLYLRLKVFISHYCFFQFTQTPTSHSLVVCSAIKTFALF